MRRLRRSAIPARGAARRRPLPRWVKPAVIAGGSIVSIGVVVGGVAWATDAGIVAAATETVREVVIEQFADAGLRVVDIVSEGQRRTTRAELAAVLSPYEGVSMIAVDLEQLRIDLEALPWVREAEIARVFPGTLRVGIVEREPIALWQREGSHVVVDRTGEVIPGRRPSRFRHLPVVVATHAPGRLAEFFSMLASEPALFRRMTGARHVGERRWDVRIDDVVDVRLPESGALEAWRRLAEQERENGVLSRAVVAVDMRLGDRMVLQLDPRLVAESSG